MFSRLVSKNASNKIGHVANRGLLSTCGSLPPINVTITGGSGQISYSAIFRICSHLGSGEVWGHDQPLLLTIYDIPEMNSPMNGVRMEVEDCSFPLVRDVRTTSNLSEAFDDCDYAFLIGAKPRGPGMERADLLKQNGKIFVDVGKAINDHASRNIKVLVVGNPCNTNCLLCANHAPDIPKKNFTAMTKLDQTRAKTQLALKTNSPVCQISQMCVWGNHSPTMYPDLRNALIGKRSALAMVPYNWISEEFIPIIQQRGTQIILARKASSAASAANAALMHMKEWSLGSEDWTSMGVYVDEENEYNVPPGIVFSFPMTIDEIGNYNIVSGIEMPDTLSKEKMADTIKELVHERETIDSLMI